MLGYVQAPGNLSGPQVLAYTRGSLPAASAAGLKLTPALPESSFHARRAAKQELKLFLSLVFDFVLRIPPLKAAQRRRYASSVQFNILWGCFAVKLVESSSGIRCLSEDAPPSSLLMSFCVGF